MCVRGAGRRGLYTHTLWSRARRRRGPLYIVSFISSCGCTYYTSQTLTRPVVIVTSCLCQHMVAGYLGPLQRVLPERGVPAYASDPITDRGILWLGREIRRMRRRRRLNAAETAAATPTLKLTPCLPHLFVCTRLERVEAAVRRQRGRIGGGIEPRRQDAQVSTALAGEG